MPASRFVAATDRVACIRGACVPPKPAMLRGAAMIIIGIDADGEKMSPQLYRCDPAGYFVGYKATSAGAQPTDVARSAALMPLAGQVVASRESGRAAEAPEPRLMVPRWGARKLCVAAASGIAGQKEQEANNFLEKRFKTDSNPSLSYDDTVQLALACLQNVLGSDLKATDIEACVVRNENLKFTRLTSDEVEGHLTALAERDDDIVARE